MRIISVVSFCISSRRYTTCRKELKLQLKQNDAYPGTHFKPKSDSKFKIFFCFLICHQRHPLQTIFNRC